MMKEKMLINNTVNILFHYRKKLKNDNMTTNKLARVVLTGFGKFHGVSENPTGIFISTCILN